MTYPETEAECSAILGEDAAIEMRDAMRFSDASKAKYLYRKYYQFIQRAKDSNLAVVYRQP